MQTSLGSVAAAAGIAAWLWSAPATAFRAQEPALPPLPLELTAFAVNVNTVPAACVDRGAADSHHPVVGAHS